MTHFRIAACMISSIDVYVLSADNLFHWLQPIC
jgi:hypothetical protein